MPDQSNEYKPITAAQVAEVVKLLTSGRAGGHAEVVKRLLLERDAMRGGLDQLNLRIVAECERANGWETAWAELNERLTRETEEAERNASLVRQMAQQVARMGEAAMLIAHEAHVDGRVYAHNGEKETPGEVAEHLERLVKRHLVPRSEES